MNNKAVATLELRLTDAQIAAIRRKHQRRAKHVKECAHVDLGNISDPTDSELMQACMDRERERFGAD